MILEQTNSEMSEKLERFSEEVDSQNKLIKELQTDTHTKDESITNMTSTM